MLVDDTLGDETLVPANERPTELSFLDVEEVDNGIVRAWGKPRIPLREVQVIDWEEVIFELTGLLKYWSTVLTCANGVMQLHRADYMCCCDDGKLRTIGILRLETRAINSLTTLQ